MIFVQRTFMVFCVLFWAFCLSGKAAGEVNGMVTLIQEDSIKINRGLSQGVQADMEFFIYRLGKPIAKIKVYQIDDYSSWGRALYMAPGEAVKIGDVVTSEALAPSFAVGPEPETSFQIPPPGAPAPPLAAAPAFSPPEGTPQPTKSVSSSPPPLLRPEDVTKRYEKKCKQNTRRFSVSLKGKGSISISPFDVLNLLSTTGVFTGGLSSSVNPYYLGSIGADMYSKYQYSKGQSQGASSSIDVVYWDNEMADVYSDYVCLKEACTDEAMRQSVRKDVYNQKGLDKSIVFFVIINNKGPGVMQLAPFSWHFYLLAKDGTRIKAEKYDEVLDRALNPNADTNGYIYFPRYDVNGQSVLGSGSVKVQLEEIMGKKQVLEFK